MLSGADDKELKYNQLKSFTYNFFPTTLGQCLTQLVGRGVKLLLLLLFLQIL